MAPGHDLTALFIATAILLANASLACGSTVFVDGEKTGAGGIAGTGGASGTATGGAGEGGAGEGGAGGAATDLVSGTVNDLPESQGYLYVQAGEVKVTENVWPPAGVLTTWWSVSNLDSSGYWYGSCAGSATLVARAPGITAIGQLTDASNLEYDSLNTGVVSEGDYVVAWYPPTDEFLAVRFDDIYPGATNALPLAFAQVTWWYVVGGDFSSP